MNKPINLICVTFSAIVFSACSWSADKNFQKVTITEDSICEYRLGQSESTFEYPFEKITVYNEDGETYKYRGKICRDSVLSEIEITNNLISKISVVEKGFCHENSCIGDSYENIKRNLPNSKLYFGGEEGGVFALEGTDGVSYIFSQDGIDVSCYVDKEKCRSKINKAKLVALVIYSKS